MLDRVRTREDHVIAVSPGASGADAQAAGAVLALGVGRAAYEGTLRWAREAVWAGRAASGGGAMLPHLHRMYRLLDGTRAIVRATCRPSDGRRAADEGIRARHARAAEAIAADAAFEVAETAVRLCRRRLDAARRAVPRRLGLRSRQAAPRRAGGTPRPEGAAAWASSRRLRRSPASSRS